MDNDVNEEDKYQTGFQKNKLTKDQGWAWFVLLGASLEMFLLVGIVKSSGILFVAFQEKFYSSSSVTSLLSTVQNICQSIMALFVMTFGIRLTTCRTLLFIGSTITCLAYIITSQATDIRVLLFSHGVLQGVGAGCMQPTALTMVSLYFEKRRSLANSIAVSGGPIGGLVFAPLITRLLSTFGYKGCVLILAGILLNGCISGALFRPTFSHNTRLENKVCLLKSKKEKREKQDLCSFAESFDENRATFSNDITEAETVNLKHTSLNNVCDNLDENVQKNLRLICHKADEKQRQCQIRYSQEMNVTNDATFVAIGYNNNSSANNIHVCDKDIIHAKRNNENVQKETSINVLDESGDLIKATSVRNDKTKANIFKFSLQYNCKLISNPIFYAFLIQGSLICSGTVVAPIFIAPYAKDLGVNEEDVATLVTTQSCIDLFSRILIGYISDKGLVRRSVIVALSTAIISISSFALGFFTDYTLLLCYSIILGLVSGVYFSLFTVVLIDYLTLEHFQTCLGFMALVHGFSVAGSFYLVGMLRDIYGSYVIPHQVIGGATAAGTLILFLLPVIQRRSKREPL